MKAWLVTWEWMADHAAVADKVAAIVNSRRSEKWVAELVEFIYAHTCYYPDELLRYARSPKKNPYRVLKDQTMTERITCGDHPWLYARKVSDLEIATDEATGIETIRWMEPPRYAWDQKAHKVKLVQRALPEQYRRRIVGPLSSELIWDREQGKLKDGFGCE